MDGLAAVAPRLVVVVGPTAAGKSGLALRLGRDWGAEIVSCDSLQVYRGLDIGSAKVSRAEQRAVPHHLIDVADPDEAFSAADYARLARGALTTVASRGRLAIVAGGSGLYLKALLDGLFAGPSRDEGLRRRLAEIAERRGDAQLHRLLGRVDPDAAARIPVRDRTRVIRALEVYRRTGQSLSDHHRGPKDRLQGFATLFLGISPDRTTLRGMIEQRTAVMFTRGLLDEARSLLARGYSRDLRPLRAIGYRQAVAVVRGEMEEAKARHDIVVETMRYAKRQMTWFRHQLEARWFPGAQEAGAAAQAWLEEGKR